MDQLNTQPPEDAPALETGGMILSSVNGADLARLPPETQLATMRQMMESLFSRVEALQQNHAVQFAGVHDRLDAVELEIPLIQEQGALRIRDLEARMSVEIEEAARMAAEEAASGLQEDVAGRFVALMAHIEGQRKELSEMRESKKLADSRLNRAVQDIERLCGNLGTHPAEEVQRPVIETVASPFRSRIAEHIRKAAVEAAPDDSNPLLKNQQSGVRTQEAVAATAVAAPGGIRSGPVAPAVPASAVAAPVPAPGGMRQGPATPAVPASAGAAPVPAPGGMRQGPVAPAVPASAVAAPVPAPGGMRPGPAAPAVPASAGAAPVSDPSGIRPVPAAPAQPVPQPEPVSPRPLAAPVESASKAGSAENVVPGVDDWKRQFMQVGEPLQPTLDEPGGKLKSAAGSAENAVPGFDDWKRQFMQEGEPLQPTLGEPGRKLKAVICPRCYSERTRPATLTRLDGIFRLTGFNPHRCRSCAHRFYKRVAASDSAHDEDSAHAPSEEVV